MPQKPLSRLTGYYVLSDIAAIVTAYYVAIALRFTSRSVIALFTFINRALDIRETGYVGGYFLHFYLDNAPRIIAQLIVAILLVYALSQLYSERRLLVPRLRGWIVLRTAIFCTLLFFAYFYLQRNVFHPRSFVFLILMLNAGFCLLFRFVLDALFRQLWKRRPDLRLPALLVGGGSKADALAAWISNEHPMGLDLAEHVPPAASFAETLENVRRRAEQHRPAMLILADPDLDIKTVMTFLEAAAELGLPAKVLSREFNVLADRAGIASDNLGGASLVHFGLPGREDGLALALRRAFCRIAAFAGLIVLSPGLLLCALAVKVTSRGPALFIQERIGVNRIPFRMLKFRTMYNRAEEEREQLEEFNESGVGLFKMRNDPRITPIGRLFRRFSIDELPQLVNVIRGDMLLVGPRPLPRRDFENYYEDWHYYRHGGMPGLTCLWQISGRSDIPFHDMCILDVYYLRNRNWIMDCHILATTLWTVLFAKGAY